MDDRQLIIFGIGFVGAIIIYKMFFVDNMTGFGVTSGLAFNNRTTYCQQGDGDAWAGGCFIPHTVIV